MSKKIPSPEEFYGFKMGADRKLARWDKIIEYYKLLDASSDRIEVTELGKSTEGNSFICVVISSAKNLANKKKLKEIASKLADPRGISDEEKKKLVEKGKSVVAFTMGLHATEVAACQMSSELAYELVTCDSPEYQEIREETVLLMFPSFNPDGQITVIDWYNKYLGTEYEGTSPPWLYHKYVGHDNARDGFQLTQVEGRMFVQKVFREWHAHAYVDFHQMGNTGARYYIPPYIDPINPNMDPVVWREHQLYGAGMAVRLQEAGKMGAESAVGYTGYWIPAFHLIGNFHNCASMITESASVRIASPVYIDPSQLGSARRGRPEYKAQTTFPNPWPGGWWCLRDLVEQQKVSALATLEVAARMKRTILKSMLLKATRNIERGNSEAPKAYIIPKEQHDNLTALKMLDTLNYAGVEVHRAKEDFCLGECVYPTGSHVIFLNQPLRGYVKTLLERTFYPDSDWTRERDGSPMRPYDLTTYTMAEFMGVRTVEVDDVICGEFEKLEEIEYPEGSVLGDSSHGYLLNCRHNDSFTAVTRLLKKGYTVSRLDEAILAGDCVLQPGAWMIHHKRGIKKDLAEEAKSLHLTFHPLDEKCDAAAHEVAPPKISMYHRYWGGNMDEGWTRWILEKFDIPYTSVKDGDIREGGLKKYDVFVIPDERMGMLTHEGLKKMFGRFGRPVPKYPPEYSSLPDDEVIGQIKEFVKSGGTLVAINGSCDFVIKAFDLPVINNVSELPTKEFYCPGSTLKVKINNCNPAAYGMPGEGLILNGNSPAFSIMPNERNQDYKVVARYPESRILQSGWLIGEEKLSRRVAMIDAKHGRGRIVLIGFRPQFRAETHGTYKLLFNVLVD
jgi:hypothetical protein